MSRKIIKVLVGIGGFVLGFLLFSLLSFNSLSVTLRIVLYSVLLGILLIIIIGIAMYMHRYNKVRLYYEVLTDFENKNIKPYFIDLGVNRSKLTIEKKNEHIYIEIKHTGFNSVLLVREEGISMGFVPDDNFNSLSDLEKERVDDLMNNSRSGKELQKLTNEELYKEFVALDNLAK